MTTALRNQELMLLGVAAVALTMSKPPKRKRIWTKEDPRKKREKLSHPSLSEESRLVPGDGPNYLGMDYDTYMELLSLVTPYIEKKNTNMREALSPHNRLSATLFFLATGRSYREMKNFTPISPQALSNIIPETCRAIQRVLQDYMKLPTTEEEWLSASKQFHEWWKLPNCLGAIGGKHVQIIPPYDRSSYFYNYKGTHSIVLIAVVNANHEFIECDLSVNGCIYDGEVIENTLFYHKLSEGLLSLPQPQPPPNSQVPLPFVFVGDDAFPLRTNFLTRFDEEELDHSKRIFNYRLSSANHVVENTLDILSKRFRIFKAPINLKVENIKHVVMACCYLHNFLSRKSSNYANKESINEAQEGLQQPEHSQLIDLEKTYNRYDSDKATCVREMFQRYFNNEGAVSWQEDMVK